MNTKKREKKKREENQDRLLPLFPLRFWKHSGACRAFSSSVNLQSSFTSSSVPLPRLQLGSKLYGSRLVAAAITSTRFWFWKARHFISVSVNSIKTRGFILANLESLSQHQSSSRGKWRQGLALSLELSRQACCNWHKHLSLTRVRHDMSKF